jgi:hypothetical protein
LGVGLIADKTTLFEHVSRIGPPGGAGVPTWINREVRVAHAKTMVIDGAVTLTGGLHELDARLRSKLDLNPGYRSGLRDALARTPRRLSPVRSARGLVPGFFRGRALMHQGRPSSRSLPAHGPREVTVLVPKGCVEDIGRFAQELRVRYRAEPAQAPQKWLALSPSAQLMVSPERSARCSSARWGARCGPLSLDRRRARQLDPVADCEPSGGALACRGGGRSLFREPG